MSWHLPVGVVALDAPNAIAKAADKALAEARSKAHGTGYVSQFDAPETKAEVADQLNAARSAAYDLVKGLGETKAVLVNLYGHANPGHQPREGWAPESVTVTVTTVEES